MNRLKQITESILAAYNKVVTVVKRKGLPTDSNFSNTWRWEETDNFLFFSRGYMAYAYVSKGGPPFSAYKLTERSIEKLMEIREPEIYMGGFATLEAAKDAVEREIIGK